MKKLLAILIIFFTIVNTGSAQLLIKKSGKSFYLDHTVAAKEGLYAIGRMYNVNPRTIASYNKIDFNKGLNIGQVLRIPLTDTNFSQKSKGHTPVYYEVGENENLQKISADNRKVPLKNLRTWNKLVNDNPNPGTKLIVGYLVGAGSPPAATIKPPEKKEADTKETADKMPAVNARMDTAMVKNKVKKDDPRKPKEDKAVTTTAQPGNKSIAKTEPATVKTLAKDESKKDEHQKMNDVARQDVTENMSGQGYFKSSFDQQERVNPALKTETVTSGIFKMASEQHGSKYYLLADYIPSGAIVRIINPENNKTIYAKVLGEMVKSKTTPGLIIRISNTAASALDISDTDKFIVTINY